MPARAVTTPPAWRIEVDDVRRPEVLALLAEHLTDMYATSPAESVHALDVDALRSPSIRVWTLWEGDALLGCGALKQLSAIEGELKSMRTRAVARGRGVARALLDHIVAEARQRGYQRVLLETGTEPYFAAARGLYARYGFVECPPFGDYQDDPHSTFFVLSLDGD